MRSGLVFTASDCQCRDRNSPGFDLASSGTVEGIWGAADEAVLNTVQKNPPKKILTLQNSHKKSKKAFANLK